MCFFMIMMSYGLDIFVVKGNIIVQNKEIWNLKVL